KRHALNEIDKAEALYQRSVDAAQLLGGIRSPLLVPGLRGLAALAAGKGDIDSALSFNLRALRIQEAVGEARKERARTLAEIALLSQLQGHDPFAEHFYRAVLEDGDGAGLQPTEVATIAGNLGAMCARSGRYVEAEPFYRQAVEVRQRELGPDDPGLAPVLYDLANLYLRLDRYADAAPHFEHALRIREKTAPNDLALSDIVSQLAATYSRLGRNNEAELHFGMAKSMLDALCTGRERTEACRSSLETYKESQELARTTPSRIATAPPPPVLEPEPVRSIARTEPAPEPRQARSPTPAATEAAPAAPPPTASPPPPVTPAPSVRTGTFYRAQIAARPARDEAEQFLHETRDAYPQLVGSLPAAIVRVDLGDRGIWFRIQVGEFDKSSEARALCKQLVDRGHDGCWAVKAEG
ncbi:MAG: tetratricopeptide repeat protein, partial [Acidobacteriota bacterium]